MINEPRRMQPNDRKAQILNAAVELSIREGWGTITREKVAEAAGISAGLVTKYFISVEQLRASVMRSAIDREILIILADGVALRDDIALSAPPKLRAQAILSCMGL